MSTRSRRHSRFLALAFLVASIALAACGDEPEATSTSEASTSSEGATAPAPETTSRGEDQFDPSESAPSPEPVIEDFLVSSDSATVCASLSPELLASTYGDVSGCRSGRPPQSLASSVKLADRIVVTGDEATAVVVPDGGAYDGADVSFVLALEGDRWVITKLKADIPVGP